MSINRRAIGLAAFVCATGLVAAAQPPTRHAIDHFGLGCAKAG